MTKDTTMPSDEELATKIYEASKESEWPEFVEYVNGLFATALHEAQTLTRAERAELESYRRQRSISLEDYHEFGNAPVGSPERMTAYISYLSLHNLREGAKVLKQWRDEAEVRGRRPGYDPNLLGSWIFVGDNARLQNLDDLYWSYVMEYMSENDPWSASHDKGFIERIKRNMPYASFGAVGEQKALARANQRAKERLAALSAERGEE